MWESPWPSPSVCELYTISLVGLFPVYSEAAQIESASTCLRQYLQLRAATKIELESQAPVLLNAFAD